MNILRPYILIKNFYVDFKSKTIFIFACKYKTMFRHSNFNLIVDDKLQLFILM